MAGPEEVPPPPTGFVFPLPQLELSPFQPVIVEGPVGSAKSTVIRQAVRECQARGIPSVYLITRGNSVHSTKTRVCQALDYPEEPSLVAQLALYDTSAENIEKARLKEALEDLVRVAAELGLERRNDPSIPEADKAPLIAFDHLDYLLQEMAPLGPYRLIDEPTGLVDTFLRQLGEASKVQGLVRVAVSSIQPMVLGIDEASVGPLRFHRQYIEDPPVEDVHKALLSLGWKPEQVERALTSCGARRMLLGGLLRHQAIHREDCPDHPTRIGSDNYYQLCACDASNRRLEEGVSHARNAGGARMNLLIGHRYTGATEEHKLQLKAVLDKLASYPLASSHEAQIQLRDLPAPYREPALTLSYGLFLRPDPAAINSRERATVLFETEGNRQAWIEQSRRIEQRGHPCFPSLGPVRW